LPTISKFYERAIFDQLLEFLYNHFNPLLSAFRSGFGCQTGRQSNAFDKSIKIAAINLLSSKAFFQSSIILSKAV
jgi:hypothetical protein